MIVAMTTTPMITTIDELMTSERVGQRDLLQLGHDLAVVLPRSGPFLRRRGRRPAVATTGLVGPLLGHLPLGLSVHRSSHGRRLGADTSRVGILGMTCIGGEQGRRDSNPQPPVLETGALPVELLPSGRGGRAARIAAGPQAIARALRLAGSAGSAGEAERAAPAGPGDDQARWPRSRPPCPRSRPA